MWRRLSSCRGNSISRHPGQQRRCRALRRPERPRRLDQQLAVNLFGTYRRDAGLPAAAGPFAGCHRQQLSTAALAPLPIIPAYSSRRRPRSPDAIVACSFRRPGRQGSRRPHRPHRHRYVPGLRHPKASPESVARAIFDGVEDGNEDIFPDPMSQSLAGSWRTGAVKAMERENAVFVTAEPTAA